MGLNKRNCIKYCIQLSLVTISSYLLSPCQIKLSFALTLGLISTSIFSILDVMYPIIIDNSNDTIR